MSAVVATEIPTNALLDNITWDEDTRIWSPLNGNAVILKLYCCESVCVQYTNSTSSGCHEKQDVYDLLAQMWRHTIREKIRLITLRGLKSHTDALWSQQLFSPLLFQSKVTFSQLEWLQGCNGLAIITITEKSSGISRIIWNVPLNNLKQVVEGGRRENLLQTDRQTDRREHHIGTCKTISEKKGHLSAAVAQHVTVWFKSKATFWFTVTILAQNLPASPYSFDGLERINVC